MREPDISPAQEAEIRARLEREAGLDLVHGLEYTLNRFPFYIRILRLFVDSNSEIPGEVRKLARLNRHQELLEIIHGLKSSTGTIGALALSNLAAAVAVAARNTQPQAVDLALEFADELERTISVVGDTLRNAFE